MFLRFYCDFAIGAVLKLLEEWLKAEYSNESLPPFILNPDYLYHCVTGIKKTTLIDKLLPILQSFRNQFKIGDLTTMKYVSENLYGVIFKTPIPSREQKICKLSGLNSFCNFTSRKEKKTLNTLADHNTCVHVCN